jgi:hypothetical protein
MLLTDLSLFNGWQVRATRVIGKINLLSNLKIQNLKNKIVEKNKIRHYVGGDREG